MSQVELECPSRPELLGLRDTAARVVRARHSGADGEDLVQEAWARAAVAVRDRGIDDPNAYAAAIAANLVKVSGRRDACRRRWAPQLFVRLVEEPADTEVLLREESDAMGKALRQLPPAARELVIAHTVNGQDTGALAATSGTSPGAVAAGLARARAMLRVEYLLAFRNLPRPDDYCLRVLYAISAGDIRRQARLNADAHVTRCPACGQVAETIRGRRRPTIGTLIALRLAKWGLKVSRFDSVSVGQQAGVAGGLVGVGVAGAIVLASVGSPHATARVAAPADQVKPASMLPVPVRALPLRSVRANVAAHTPAKTNVVRPAARVHVGGVDKHLSAPVGPDVSGNVSGAGLTITLDNHQLSTGAPPLFANSPNSHPGDFSIALF